MRRFFEKSAAMFAEYLGSSWAIALALFVPLTWIYILAFSRDQEVLGVSRTTLVEFANMFMFIYLFLMQRTQNKNLKAMHLKLDELIASKDGANNALIKAEGAPEDVIDDLHEKYANLAKSNKNSTDTLTVEDKQRRSA